MTAVITCDGLGRSYGDMVAVERVSFTMEEGEFLGLLGPNGAGKSTLLNMLTTLIAPSRGEATVAGADIRRAPGEVRARLGVVFQDPALDERLTARENLRVHAALYRMDRRAAPEAVAAALRWAELDVAADRPVRAFSGGMRRRLELARALMHGPRLLVLDEPTLGLDAQGRRDLWDRITRLRADGLSVLMTTHNMAEAEGCTRVGVVDRGRLVDMGAPAELRARHGGGTLEDAFVQLTGRAPRDAEAGPGDRIVAFRKRGREVPR
jgi:ABC-2 type transport system ATP-binding protein